ncbi:PAAR domain-containing protein [Massilia sp. UMI-21]|nr:PAAR domain-containing protein [Massilia sp. UMI-21]
MRIIGWIREGDQAACGEQVIEGDPCSVSDGRSLSFEGARMGCAKGCVIAEGHGPDKLFNDRSPVLHGMKTSGGCPLLSTLNDIDGIGNDRGEEVPIRFIQNSAGEWVGKENEGYDQQFVLTDTQTGETLANRHYRIIFNGKTIEGKTDASGKTVKVEADDPTEVILEILPEGYGGGR